MELRSRIWCRKTCSETHGAPTPMPVPTKAWFFRKGNTFLFIDFRQKAFFLLFFKLSRRLSTNSPHILCNFGESFLFMKKILVPVDFSDHSAHALKIAADLARKNNLEIIVLHVMEVEEPLMGT